MELVKTAAPPTIKTTLGALATAEPTLKRLAEIRLPAKTAYLLSRWCRAVMAETAHYHAQRDTSIRELGVLDEATDQISVTPENIPEFVKRMTEMNAVEVELTLRPISLLLLFGVDLTPMEVLSLDPMLMVDPDEEE